MKSFTRLLTLSLLIAAGLSSVLFAQQSPAPAPTPDSVVARVNNEPITRQQLGDECLLHFGRDVAEKMMNKYLIQTECHKRNIVITQDEVRAEIERLAKSFNLPVTQWLNLLRDERGINEQQYSEDIIWPSLALKAIAKDQIVVNEQEIAMAYDRLCGPSVEARIIVLDTPEKAAEIHKIVAADPSRFVAMAKQHSIDTNTASRGGMAPAPLRMHTGFPEFDKAVFSLKPGQVSNVLNVGNQYLIVYCERINPSIKDKNPLTDDLKKRIIEEIKVQKLSKVSNDIFAQLQQNAKVTIVLGNPQLERQYPTAAILIDGKQIGRKQVAEKAIERHGAKVLNGLIQFVLVEQAAKKAGITVTDKDVDAQIASIAADALPLTKNGEADVERWYATVAREHGLSREQYRKQMWSQVALTKMVEPDVRIENDDIQKGYEANYGPRVRVRAIILNDMRSAQRVWAEARKNPTEKNFGDLCEQYCVDPNIRAIRGEVPPIQKHGGIPELESEAFKLSPGELSDIVTVGQTFIIMYCLGQTQPDNIPLADVKDLIIKDVRQKKIDVLMAALVEQIMENGTWENLLSGEVHTPRSSLVPADNAQQSGADK
ncbi:MAG: SurA N-terminal domain-containing protein [Thermoguttaceae bacterium]|nr:SurA N-terminal domain-containing protein [Thermoguttaceae bacterium]